MQHVSTAGRTDFFKPLMQSAQLQAAVMVLKPGQSSSDEPEDEHPKAEQWLVVVSGTGRARGGGRPIRLKAGSLLLIEKNEPHQITNTGTAPLVTINFYAPPAYTLAGSVKASVSRPRRR